MVFQILTKKPPDASGGFFVFGGTCVFRQSAVGLGLAESKRQTNTGHLTAFDASAPSLPLRPGTRSVVRGTKELNN
jgi:hypothetical protein